MSDRTVARPYAKAVFEMAMKDKKLAEWSDILALSADLASDKRVASLMKDPKVTPAQIEDLFMAAGKDVFTKEAENLIKILGDFKRLSLLPEMSKLYEELRSKAEQVVTVELISAFPITDSDQQRFKEVLKRRLNSDITLEVSTDKSILGGAIIRAGDLVIDGSVRGRLAKLSEAMGIS